MDGLDIGGGRRLRWSSSAGAGKAAEVLVQVVGEGGVVEAEDHVIRNRVTQEWLRDFLPDGDSADAAVLGAILKAIRAT